MAIWSKLMISPYKKPQAIATIGIKYVQLDAKTVPDSFISWLKAITDKAEPKMAKMDIKNKEEPAAGFSEACFTTSVKPNK